MSHGQNQCMPMTDTIDQPGQRRPNKGDKPKSALRTDIQGMRALAAGLIVFYHLWPGKIHGGFTAVDIFFVVSGFLITSHLMNHPPASGRDLANFWMRRIRRLMPAAMTVIVGTMIAVRIFMPDTQWRTHAQEAIASALYFQNWELAGQSVDYMESEGSASALQHYWSLSVEEQFYAVWPVLLVACVLIARRMRLRTEIVALIAISILWVASVAYSISFTKSNPEQAYFVTPTRVFAFATGALLAISIRLIGERVAQARGIRVAGEFAVWGGYAAVAYSVVMFDGTNFPGLKGLLPVLGTAAIIAGYSERGLNPNALLRNRPAQYLGDISYSVYLWHWPVIVIMPYAIGRELGLVDTLAAGALGLALGALTKHFVEDRFRTPRPRQALVSQYRWAIAGMAAVVGLGLLQSAEVDQRTKRDLRSLQLAAQNTDPCFAANALRRDDACPLGEVEVKKVVPSPALAPRDRSFSYNYDCQTQTPFSDFKSCVFGDRTAKRNVALVGNSHAIHWLPALHQVALKEHFKITTFFTEQCFATNVRIDFSTPQQTENCHKWGQEVLRQTGSKKFDLIVTSNRTYKQPVEKGPRNEVFEKGYAEYVKDWIKAGTKVMVLRDTPLPDATIESVPECVAENKNNPAACSGERNKWIRTDPLADAVRELDDKRAIVANLSDSFCTETRCPSVIGRTMVYFDASHMTATYARSLAPELGPIITKALGPDTKEPKDSKDSAKAKKSGEAKKVDSEEHVEASAGAEQ